MKYRSVCLDCGTIYIQDSYVDVCLECSGSNIEKSVYVSNMSEAVSKGLTKLPDAMREEGKRKAAVMNNKMRICHATSRKVGK